MSANEINEYGQPIGGAITGWQPPGTPEKQAMDGRYCGLEPLDVAAHASDLFAANSADAAGKNWTYLPYGPIETLEEYENWITAMTSAADPQFYAVIPKAIGKPVGVASLLRIDPGNGSIEVGHIHFSNQLKQTPAATESMFMMMKCAFELGYRRYEWKCDALNAASRSAAERLGFSFEGIFRQATVYKGRNRDTAWYSIVDSEWPEIGAAFERWLDPSNFDANGKQLSSLRTKP